MKKLLCLFFMVVYMQAQTIHLPAIFSDNMVLQQNRSCKIWGSGAAHHKVTIRASWGARVEAQADAGGNWQAELPTASAGGPHTILIKSGPESIQLKNVLLGEVWLCSGQSNMEMPLAGWPPQSIIDNSEAEIAAAEYPQIRLFTVRRDLSLSPEPDCVGQWRECRPETARSFSATGYFFGRMLHKELGLPIGLIHSSWGGTPAESWMDKTHLRAFSEFQQILQTIDSGADKISALEKWREALPQLQVNEAQEDKWARLDFKDQRLGETACDDQAWKTMRLPTVWEQTDLGQFDGVVWFRKKVDIPADLLGQDLILQLGPIDDMDVTWFNGVPIGEHQQEGLWQENRIYPLPADLLRPKDNVIAVRVMDNQGGGGIYGKPGQMKIYSAVDSSQSIPVSGLWKYLPIAEYKGGTFYLYDIPSRQFYQRPQVPFDLGPHTPTSLFNAMIYPLLPFAIRGAIWYQGESNAGRPKQYRSLFPGLIQNWRDAWQQGAFPFYFVQIAPYDYGNETRSQELREAQMMTLKVPNTGMAVTLDIGNPQNIHPANKQEVGRRLALWALARTYGREIAFSGPLYKSMEVVENKALISFDYAENGLWLKNGASGHFLIAGEDRIFHEGRVEIRGDQLLVWHAQVKEPRAVRYLWDNTSEATLFNADGLPASSFRTDDWDE